MRWILLCAGLLSTPACADEYFKQREYDRSNNFIGQTVTHPDPGNHTTTTDIQDRNFNVIGHERSDASGRITRYDRNWNVIGSSRPN